jgi:K+-sensing histidine kinase KdpD
VRPESDTEQAFWLQVDGIWLSREQKILVRLYDISEKTNLERQHKRFHTLVSHKLRTPLIDMSALQIIKLKLKENTLNDKAMDLLDMAIENSERLQNQVLDILRYVETTNQFGGAGTNSYSDFTHEGTPLSGIAAILDTVAANLNLQQPISLNIAKETSQTNLALDPVALQCVLEHLISNSYKFHPQKKPTIEIEIYPGTDNITKLDVLDDGQNLAPGELNKLLQPYYQSEKYFTGEVAGMGLGLSAVATLIWGVGGHLKISNRNDKPGLKVCLQIPCKKQKQQLHGIYE